MSAILPSITEKAVFGADAKLHPISGRPLENGSGALHPDAQAVGHLGLMIYELAELKQRQRDRVDTLSSETARRNTILAEINRLRPEEESTRQNLANNLTQLNMKIGQLERQCAPFAKENDDLTAKIVEVRAKLTDDGIIERHGWAPATVHFGAIKDKGWEYQIPGGAL